jgi:hypothetical protein
MRVSPGGAIRDSDQVVFLRVWQDQCKTLEGRRVVLVDIPPAHTRPDQETNGRDERRMHLAKIKSGAQCYMVMCEAKDASSEPRKIKNINRDDLFQGGKVVETDAGVWLEIAARVPVRDVAA